MKIGLLFSHLTVVASILSCLFCDCTNWDKSSDTKKGLTVQAIEDSLKKIDRLLSDTAVGLSFDSFFNLNNKKIELLKNTGQWDAWCKSNFTMYDSLTSRDQPEKAGKYMDDI